MRMVAACVLLNVLIVVAKHEKEALKASRDVCKIVPAKLGEQIGDYAALSVAFGK